MSNARVLAVALVAIAACDKGGTAAGTELVHWTAYDHGLYFSHSTVVRGATVETHIAVRYQENTVRLKVTAGIATIDTRDQGRFVGPVEIVAVVDDSDGLELASSGCREPVTMEPEKLSTDCTFGPKQLQLMMFQVCSDGKATPSTCTK